MNPNPIFQDDPRLTLYALGEMEPREQAEFEKLLEQDAAARQVVTEIRATVATVTAALADEEMSEPARVAAIIPGRDPRKLDGGPLAPLFRGRVIRFPQAYFMISGLAAACFAVFFVLWQNGQQHTQLIEVPLVAAKDAKEAGTLPATPAPTPAVTIGRSDEANAPQEQAVVLDKFSAGEMRVAGDSLARRNEADQAAMATMQKARLAPAVAFAETAKKTESGAITAAYRDRKDDDFLRVADQPRSTFPVKVGTASYANVRRFLAQKQRPPADAVRIEELVNHFPYHYAPPTGDAPFAANLEVAGAPWAPEHRLVRIGLKGREAGGTPVTIAKDVKIQVEFNPAQVSAYRLIGYENGLPASQDFNGDKVDAGDIGVGHTVTALYEVVPAGVEPDADPLKYQKPVAANDAPAAKGPEMLTVSIRYNEPAGEVGSKLEFPLVDAGARFADASPDFKFAAAVAGFGMMLRDSPHLDQLTLANIAEWGRAGLDQDAGGYRSEFLSLVGEAGSLLR